MSESILSGNAIVGQSGGPTAAINATLSGIVKELMEHPEVQNIYGAKHGIVGIMNEDIVDLRRFFCIGMYTRCRIRLM